MAFCLASFLSNAGGWMQAGAVPYIVFQTTGSAAWVGLAGFVAFLPSMICTVPGGVLADRFDRTKVLISTQLLMAVVTVPVCVDATNSGVSMTLLLAVLGCQSALLGLGVASFQTLAPALVQTPLRAKAINLNSAQAQVAKTVGPLLAGFTLANAGIAVAFVVNAITFVVTAAVLFAIRKTLAPDPGKSAKGSTLEQLSTGLRSVWHHPSRRSITALVAVAVFLGAPVYQFVAPMAESELQVGAGTYGVLVALYGTGAVLGNVFNHFVNTRTSTLVMGAVATFGTGIFVFAVGPVAWVAGLGLLVAGSGYLLVTVTLLTRIQVVTPDYLRGRVVAVYSLFFIGGVPFGNLLQGWMAQFVGVRPTLTMAASGLWLVAAFLWFRPRAAAALNEAPVVDLDEHDTAPVPTYGRN